jgi:prephenate dehydratase
MRVGFLGPAGTFTEEALRASPPRGAEIEEVSYASEYETVMAVQAREVDRAVAPIENSLEGSVTATLDALAGEAEDVRIVAEVVRPVSHSLVAPPGLSLEDVRRVISHPQAIAQCVQFLREHLPDAEIGSAPSTADAVRSVASSGERAAALGPRLAADLYGCAVLAEGVEDRHDNHTRFVWLAPAGTDSDSPATKTSIVFWGFNDQSPGALMRVLGELAEREINLTKIESRPRRVRLGHYMFFADLEGAASAEPVADALKALGERVQTLKVLGSYPVFGPPEMGG